MIKAKEQIPARRVPPPVLNGSKAPKAKPKRKAGPNDGLVKVSADFAKKVKKAMEPAMRGEVDRECPTCKRPFPMTPAERQRKRRAKLAKLNKARK